jgi:hypothetical protein
LLKKGGMLYDVPMAVLGLLHDFKRLSESFFHTFLCQWVVLVSNGIVGILDSIYVSEGFEGSLTKQDFPYTGLQKVSNHVIPRM